MKMMKIGKKCVMLTFGSRECDSQQAHSPAEMRKSGPRYTVVRHHERLLENDEAAVAQLVLRNQEMVLRKSAHLTRRQILEGFERHPRAQMVAVRPFPGEAARHYNNEEPNYQMVNGSRRCRIIIISRKFIQPSSLRGAW